MCVCRVCVRAYACASVCVHVRVCVCDFVTVIVCATSLLLFEVCSKLRSLSVSHSLSLSLTHSLSLLPALSIVSSLPSLVSAVFALSPPIFIKFAESERSVPCCAMSKSSFATRLIPISSPPPFLAIVGWDVTTLPLLLSSALCNHIYILFQIIPSICSPKHVPVSKRVKVSC